MTFSGVARPGQRGTSGSVRTNFAIIIKEKVLDDFARMCYLKDRHMTTVGTGQAIEITSRGLAVAKTRTDDATLTFRQPDKRIFGKQTVRLENEKYSMQMISDWNRIQREPQYRDDLAKDVADSLARQWDSAVCLKIMRGAAATSSALNTTFDGGATYEIARPSAATTASLANLTGPELVRGTVGLSAMFDDDDLPSDLPRYLGVTPSDHGKMVVEKDATTQNPIDTRVGGEGSIADGKLMRVGSMSVIPMTVLSPLRANITASDANWGGSGANAWVTDLTGDFRKVAAIAWTPEAVATAVWGGPYADVQMQPRGSGRSAFLSALGGGFAVATFYYGLETLRESCAGRITIK